MNLPDWLARKHADIAAVEDWHERETLSGQVPEQCDECGGAA